jgi:hypothetical protein
MFNILFGLLEVIGFIGVVRACIGLHGYCLNHAWLRHTTEAGAWTVALGYGLGAIILFWLAHLSAGSIYLLVFGLAGGGGVVSIGLIALLAVVVGHVIYGAFLLIPYLARFLAFFSSRGK